MSFKDELEDIPEEIEHAFSGSVSIGKTKVPKAVIIGGVIVIVAVVFVVLKNKGKGGTGGQNSNPTSNIPNAFTPDSGSGSGQGGSGGSGSVVPTSGDLIGNIPLPSIPLPDFSSVGFNDNTQIPSIPYMSSGGGYFPDSPFIPDTYNPSLPVTQSNDPSGGHGIISPLQLPKGGVKRGVVTRTPVTKQASSNNPLTLKGSSKAVSNGQMFGNILQPAVNSVKPLTNVVSIFSNFISGFSQPKAILKPPTNVTFSKLPNAIPSQPKVINSYKAPVSAYTPYTTPNYIPYSVPKNIPVAAKPTPKVSSSGRNSATRN